jgi:hypothetical protein
VIGDSVLLGGLLWGPTIGDQLSASGWGPIRSRAGEGYSTGLFPTTSTKKVTTWLAAWRDEGWDPPNVLVNLGANDSGICDTDLTCARDAILHVVEAIGPGHRIWWPQITRFPFYFDQQNNWNTALQQIAAERDDFFTWDWPTVMANGPFSSSDNTHLSVSGYRLRSELMAREVTADLGMATRIGNDATLPAPSGSPSELVPVGPVRVIDTREDEPGHLDARSAVEVDVSDHVPEGTTAIAAYVSATRTGGNGYLTAYECSSDRPTASNANYRRAEARGAVAITPIGPEGTFCLYTHADADVIVDLQAAFVPVGSGGGRFSPLASPDRLVDTRDTGQMKEIEVAVPPGADVAAVSITAIASELPGYLVAYPCSDERPVAATVNHLPGEVISGAAFVPVGADGTICVWSRNPVDVTVDLTGVFSSTGDLVFVPAPPTRTVDTRFGTGGWGPIHGQFQQIDARVAPAEAEAVSGTLTMVAPLRPGYLRVWGCGDQPATANVTSLAGGALANMVTTGVDDTGRLCLFARSATGTLFDTTGWWVPASEAPA